MKPIILVLLSLVTTISCEKTNEIVDEKQLLRSKYKLCIVYDSKWCCRHEFQGDIQSFEF